MLGMNNVCILLIDHRFRTFASVGASIFHSQHYNDSCQENFSYCEGKCRTNRTRLCQRNFHLKLGAQKQLSSLSVLSHSCRGNYWHEWRKTGSDGRHERSHGSAWGCKGDSSEIYWFWNYKTKRRLSKVTDLTCQVELRCAVPAINFLTRNILSIRIDPQSSKPTTRLAQEVMEAIESDPMHGPRQDRLRHAIGIEYEAMLEKCLNELGKVWRAFFSLRVLRASYILACYAFRCAIWEWTGATRTRDLADARCSLVVSNGSPRDKKGCRRRWMESNLLDRFQGKHNLLQCFCPWCLLLTVLNLANVR